MTKSKKGKVSHLTGVQYEKIKSKIEDGKKITKKERELLECQAFDNYYIWDNHKYFDSNWEYLNKLTDQKLIDDIEEHVI